jgi:hypothetical protein
LRILPQKLPAYVPIESRPDDRGDFATETEQIREADTRHGIFFPHSSPSGPPVTPGTGTTGDDIGQQAAPRARGRHRGEGVEGRGAADPAALPILEKTAAKGRRVAREERVEYREVGPADLGEAGLGERLRVPVGASEMGEC